MDLLVIPVRTINRWRQAYYFRYQKNKLMKANQAPVSLTAMPPRCWPPSMQWNCAFTMDKPIYVPVNLMLLADLAQQQSAKRSSLFCPTMFGLRSPILAASGLKEKGFRFAVQKLDRVDIYASLWSCDCNFSTIGRCIIPASS